MTAPHLSTAYTATERFSAIFHSLSYEARELLAGRECNDPMSHAFKAKRVIHPGVGLGKPAVNPGFAFKTAASAKSLDIPEHIMAYVHIPFCSSQCNFCSFYQGNGDDASADAFINSLIQELALTHSQVTDWPRPLSAVYVGGGTPTDLSAANIERLIQAIRKYLPLRTDAEITLEGRLSGFTNDRYRAAINAGVNRFSFGVQTFNSKIRQGLGRKLSGDEISNRLAELSSKGEALIACDLIYGLPNQYLTCWQKDIQALIQTGVDAVSVYQLAVLENLPLHQAIKQGSLSRPASLAEQASYYQLATQLLPTSGYKQAHQGHFSRTPNERSLYNRHAKSEAWVMPFGCQASGFWNGMKLMNHRKIEDWHHQVKQNNKPLQAVFGRPRLGTNILALTAMLEVEGTLPWQQARTLTHCNIQSCFRPLFEAWRDAGLAQLDSVGLHLTMAGQYWSSNLAQALLDAWGMAKKGEIPHALRRYQSVARVVSA